MMNPEQNTNWAAWAKVLSSSDEEIAAGDAEFFRRLAEAKELPAKVNRAVSLTVLDAEHRDYLLAPLVGVESGLRASSEPSHTISQVWKHFSEKGETTRSAAIYSLRGCALELERSQVEVGLTEAAGRDLTDLINGLTEAVLESELEELDKQFLLGHLNEIRAAVQQARLRGRYPVEEAVDAAHGGLIRRPNLLVRIGEAQLIDRVIVFFTKINSVLALAGQTEQLTQQTVNALERGTGG